MHRRFLLWNKESKNKQNSTVDLSINSIDVLLMNTLLIQMLLQLTVTVTFYPSNVIFVFGVCNKFCLVCKVSLTLVQYVLYIFAIYVCVYVYVYIY